MNENILGAKAFEHNITVENVTLTFIGNSHRHHSERGISLPPIYHNHVYGELFFCKRGELSLKYGDTNHTLYEGDIVFIPPRIPHFSFVSEESTVINVGIILRKKTVRENFNAYKKLDRLFSSPEPVFFRRYSPILPEEMSWIEEISSGSFLPSVSAFYTLLRLAENYKSHMSGENDKVIGNKKATILMQIENFIGGKYYENITAEELSSMLYISPRQLARIVKERYGAPLHQIIMKKRIESAAKLLLETTLSVEQISSYVGFSTKSCFYRAFKEEYNVTPLQYKKINA